MSVSRRPRVCDLNSEREHLGQTVAIQEPRPAPTAPGTPGTETFSALGMPWKLGARIPDADERSDTKRAANTSAPLGCHPEQIVRAVKRPPPFSAAGAAAGG